MYQYRLQWGSWICWPVDLVPSMSVSKFMRFVFIIRWLIVVCLFFFLFCLQWNGQHSSDCSGSKGDKGGWLLYYVQGTEKSATISPILLLISVQMWSYIKKMKHPVSGLAHQLKQLKFDPHQKAPFFVCVDLKQDFFSSSIWVTASTPCSPATISSTGFSC